MVAEERFDSVTVCETSVHNIFHVERRVFVYTIIITPPAVTASGVSFFEVVFITPMKKGFSIVSHGLM